MAARRRRRRRRRRRVGAAAAAAAGRKNGSPPPCGGPESAAAMHPARRRVGPARRTRPHGDRLRRRVRLRGSAGRATAAAAEDLRHRTCTCLQLLGCIDRAGLQRKRASGLRPTGTDYTYYTCESGARGWWWRRRRRARPCSGSVPSWDLRRAARTASAQWSGGHAWVRGSSCARTFAERMPISLSAPCESRRGEWPLLAAQGNVHPWPCAHFAANPAVAGAVPRKFCPHLASTRSASAKSNAAAQPRPIHIPHRSNSIGVLRPLEEVHLVHALSFAQNRRLQAAVELLKRATIQPQLGALGTKCMCPTGPAVVYLLRCHVHAAAAR